ncbi:hypothetical protein PHISCL_10863 [Aspergillus sclerotialis]|uniref:Uncharacterized protein n=1 Tax=Aspergillus sclerotialis TaxID=2070753 RepID=A0A3A2Z225_9EURO|nr:hypothetical protein PHISCL_10863 [Aspergillus sclerotialis]
MVIRAQVLDQMVSSRKAVVVFPQAVSHGAVLFDRKVDAGFMALKVRRSGKRLPAADAAELSRLWPARC